MQRLRSKREYRRLRAKDVQTIIQSGKPGKHSDGECLYLQRDQSGAARWVFQFELRGRQREMGLGGCRDVSLLQAREKAAEARKLLREGYIFPIDRKRASKAAVAAGQRTFAAIAEDFIASKQHTWRGIHTAQSWRTSLLGPSSMILHNMPIAEIDVPHILQVLQPIWTKIPVQARKHQNRIEQLLNYATAHGLRAGPNPARYRGHLEMILAKRDGAPSRHEVGGPSHLYRRVAGARDDSIHGRRADNSDRR